jgi:Fur family transcriptional regulator, peroxide stress response regulator
MAENYQKIISDKGIRPSVQRVIIYQYLSEHRIHPTVDTVYTALAPSYPTLSRTTVYNTLKLFAFHHLIQIVKIEDDELRYDADISAHIHLKCSECGQVFDYFNEPLITSFQEQCINKLPSGFSAEQIQTNIWGKCADCKKK